MLVRTLPEHATDYQLSVTNQRWRWAARKEMMPFTKAYAKILAGMILPEELVAFRFICGKNEARQQTTLEVIDNLVDLELVRRDTDGKHDLVLLTPKGKKVAEFV